MVLTCMMDNQSPVSVEVDAVAAYQMDRSISLDQLEGSFVWDQDVHILLVVLPAPHRHDGSHHLGVVVALGLHLHHARLASLGAWHQYRGLEQQPVAGLDAGVLRVLVILVRGILGAPGVLLAGAGELARPQILLLVIIARNLVFGHQGHRHIHDGICRLSSEILNDVM